MKRLSLSLLLLLSFFSAMAKDEPEVDFFVRVVAQPSEVIKGDSTLVSYVLYATAPFSKAELQNKEIKVKNARVRRLSRHRGGGMSQVREKGRVYYTVVGAQYVVSSEDVGTLTMPSCKFKAAFRFRESSRDPFEEFFGYGGRVFEVESEAKSEPLKIKVKEKPRRTTLEMMNDGLM